MPGSKWADRRLALRWYTVSSPIEHRPLGTFDETQTHALLRTVDHEPALLKIRSRSRRGCSPTTISHCGMDVTLSIGSDKQPWKAHECASHGIRIRWSGK